MRHVTITRAIALLVMFLFNPIAEAARVVAVDPEFDVAGTTSTSEGTTFSFSNFTSTSDSGTDRSGTFSTSGDHYISLTGLSLDTRVYRYVQVFYTLDSDFSGTTHQLRLDTSDQSPDFVTYLDNTTIPGTTGSHSIVIDLLDRSDLDASIGSHFSGNLTFLRLDIWNTATVNDGKVFTLDKVVFASQQASNTLLIDDADFESPVVGAGVFEQGPSPSDWTWGANSGIIEKTHGHWAYLQAGGAPPQGDQGAILLGGLSADITRTVTGLSPGATYTIGFDSTGRRSDVYGILEYKVLINGTALTFSGSETITPITQEWRAFISDEFKAPYGTPTLTFDVVGNTTGNGTSASYLDFIRFNYVADPSQEGLIFMVR